MPVISTTLWFTPFIKTRPSFRNILYIVWAEKIPFIPLKNARKALKMRDFSIKLPVFYYTLCKAKPPFIVEKAADFDFISTFSVENSVESVKNPNFKRLKFSTDGGKIIYWEYNAFCRA